jgi:hypothetical protein
MKFRVTYRERSGREHRDLIGAETPAQARAIFKQSFPTARLVSLVEIQPSARRSAPAGSSRPQGEPVSDEEFARLAEQASQLKAGLRHKLRV